jgi:hypothetical protein
LTYRRLFIWVEGADDIRFFDGVIKPVVQANYDLVQVIPYASLKRDKIDRFIRSIQAMKADYIYVNDINKATCVTGKKQQIKDKLRNVEREKIAVVVKEIESWYLAGLSDTHSKKLKINRVLSTDDISKEQFNNLIPKKFGSRIDFILEILKYFSIKIAMQKNTSFRYFIEKYIARGKNVRKGNYSVK